MIGNYIYWNIFPGYIGGKVIGGTSVKNFDIDEEISSIKTDLLSENMLNTVDIYGNVALRNLSKGARKAIRVKDLISAIKNIDSRLNTSLRDDKIFSLIKTFGLPTSFSQADDAYKQMVSLYLISFIYEDYLNNESPVRGFAHTITLYEQDQKIYFASPSEQCKVIKKYANSFANEDQGLISNIWPFIDSRKETFNDASSFLRYKLNCQELKHS